MRGIPTVLVTVRPEESKPMRPPRALYPVGFELGRTFGSSGRKELQREVLLDALRLLLAPPAPGAIQERTYVESGA